MPYPIINATTITVVRNGHAYAYEALEGTAEVKEITDGNLTILRLTVGDDTVFVRVTDPEFIALSAQFVASLVRLTKAGDIDDNVAGVAVDGKFYPGERVSE